MPAPFADIITRLERHYGRPPPPRITDPWHMILHENAAYLVDDDRRDEVFESLRRRIGLRPVDILRADRADLAAAIAHGGMQPDRRAQKLIDAAEILSELPGADLRRILAQPEKQARKILKQFPGIGDPSADRIFLFTRTHAIPALDSNGLRALIRLGYGAEGSSYAATYKSAQAALASPPASFDLLIAAYHLLRTHGQSLCRRNDPECPTCPLRAHCPFAGAAAERRPARRKPAG